MKKRRILIDLRYLSYLNYGFGQLSLSYGNYFLTNPDKYIDLDITLLVPKEYVGKFGNNVKYIKLIKLYKFLPFLFPTFDISHSVTQQIKYTPLGKTFRILTIHDLNYLYCRKDDHKIARKDKQMLFRIQLADLITVISNFTKEEIQGHFNLEGKPLSVNHNGLRDITKDTDRKPLFVQSDRKFFFTVSSISEKKNLHVLLDLMSLMPDYDLFICGNKTSPYAKDMASQIEEKGLRNVFMTGEIEHEEKVWMYKNCHAFFFPSKFEGFGMPVIEAMSFCKPVFISTMTSLKEIGGKYAFFWENFEAGYMKKVIEDNIDSFYANADYQQAQKEYALSYSMERHMERFFDLYRSVNLNKSITLFRLIKSYLAFIRA